MKAGRDLPPVEADHDFLLSSFGSLPRRPKLVLDKFGQTNEQQRHFNE